MSPVGSGKARCVGRPVPWAEFGRRSWDVGSRRDPGPGPLAGLRLRPVRPSWRLVWIAFLLCVLPAAGQGAVDDPIAAAAPGMARVADGALRIERGAGRLPLFVPPAEKLDFRVEISIGPIRRASVGRFELATGVEPYRTGLPLPGQAPADEGRVGWLRSTAKGGHLGYHVEHEYLVRHLPVDWPRTIFRDTQSGSENRRRELKLGEREGRLEIVYRSDRHCSGCDRREHVVAGAFPWQGEKHCERCKRAEHRVWRDPQTRALPGGTVDMLSAVYLARSLILADEERVTFPLIDKTRVWDVLLERGRRAVIETRAGSFDAYQVVLSTTLPEGEEPSDGEFEGLFGIRGSIEIWVHALTGVPVRIAGVVPVGPLKLDAAILLGGYQGTPSAFVPIER